MILIVLGSLAAIAGAAVCGYLVGEGEAPNAEDAVAAERSAYEENLEEARIRAADGTRKDGLEAGLERGRELGVRSGHSDGTRAGSKRAAARAEAAEAAAAAAAAAAATPEDLCRHLLGSPGEYGICLENEGQDPGAPLTDYCAAHPDIEAQSGFCPSLNE